DSATMREVIKIAFRRENFNVITCADAASALGQFDQNPPDAVITDVIMPDTDGYSVCTQIREHAQFSATPVILMSGVVNKSVADAFTPRPPAPAAPAPFAAPQQRPAPTGVDMQKLRAEISRLELLIKKLQTELQIERQYNQALEVHVRTLTALDQS